MHKQARPRILWFKQRMPTVVRDGTSLVTMNLVECLAEVFSIDLVTLRVTGKEDDAKSAICPPFQSVEVVQPDNAGSTLKRAIYRAGYEVQAALTGVPRTILYSSGPNVRNCLSRVFSSRKYALAVFEYYTAAPLLSIANCPTALILIDASYKSLEYLRRGKHGLKGLIDALRVDTLKRFEASVAARADRCFAISERDIALLHEAGNRTRIDYLPVVFPHLRRPNSEDVSQNDSGNHRVAFVGNLAYEENSRALTWFVDRVLPAIRAALPNAELYVFGGGRDHLPPAYRARDGVQFVGWVDDLGRALAQCQCGVAPSISGTGVKIKVLEMMWHGVPIVATSIAAAGTPASRGAALIADDPLDFAQKVVSVLVAPVVQKELQQRASERMVSDHCGDAIRNKIQETFRELCDH
jgi:glycosyltransferase involved in cell wall biosynthesis